MFQGKQQRQAKVKFLLQAHCVTNEKQGIVYQHSPFPWFILYL